VAAPLSAPSIARLKTSWQAEYATWKHRRLDELEPVYVWADGIYIKAGLEKDKAAMLVLIAAGRSSSSWRAGIASRRRVGAALLRDLTARGLRAPRLLIADGHLGIWGAAGAVFPMVGE
jgi:transposase-like protein